MSWITPKTIWALGDYYNLEDAQRIAGNITYLRDMALEIYPAAVTCLVYEYGKNASRPKEGEKYGICEVTLNSLNTYDASYYTHETIPWFTYDPVNFITLYKLVMLSARAEPVYIENHDIAYDSTPIYYSGYAIVTRSGSTTEMSDPQTALDERYSSWMDMGPYVIRMKNRMSITAQWLRDSQGRRTINMSAGNSNFKNSRFWGIYELGYIEYLTKMIYHKFISYIGG